MPTPPCATAPALQEAAEAIGVAILMTGGPATIYGPRGYAAFQEFHAAAHPADGAAPAAARGGGLTVCSRTTCRTCGKASYSGCGRHVEQVLAGIPQSQRCACPPSAREGSLLSRLVPPLRRHDRPE